ncbi:MAG: hypothetical protein KF882_05520 [Bacteroidia bacterium]|nr:hypothetical protein [Bacteroidia bacterium]MCO5254354.1 hypothetical protein [Bacteroidota bacterium]
MKSYPNIDFSSFSIIESCDFVSDRIHQDISRNMNALTKSLFENDGLFLETDKEQVLSILFVQLKDECEQLIRLESFVFLPFLRKKIILDDYTLPESAVDKIFNYQHTVLTLLYRLKHHVNDFKINQHLLPVEQIIINDLSHLEILMSDWTNIVREKIVKSIRNKLSDNEFA